MLIQHEVSYPPPFQERFEDRMEGPDKGIVNAWLAGLTHRRTKREWRKAAEAGELPVLPYRGGVEKATKKKTKVGSLLYLAMWQGLRGDDLDIDTEDEPVHTCARFGTSVLFTADSSKFQGQDDE